MKIKSTAKYYFLLIHLFLSSALIGQSGEFLNFGADHQDIVTIGNLGSVTDFTIEFWFMLGPNGHQNFQNQIQYGGLIVFFVLYNHLQSYQGFYTFENLKFHNFSRTSLNLPDHIY